MAELVQAALGDNDILTSSAHSPIVNEALAVEVKRRLRQLGVNMKSHTGIIGTGLFSSPNEYTNIATGERMTHLQVLGLLQAKSNS